MLHAAEHEIVQYLQHNATQLDLVVPCRTLERYTSYTSYTLVAFALSKVIPTVCPWGPQAENIPGVDRSSEADEFT